MTLAELLAHPLVAGLVVALLVATASAAFANVVMTLRNHRLLTGEAVVDGADGLVGRSRTSTTEAVRTPGARERTLGHSPELTEARSRDVPRRRGGARRGALGCPSRECHRESRAPGGALEARCARAAGGVAMSHAAEDLDAHDPKRPGAELGEFGVAGGGRALYDRDNPDAWLQGAAVRVGGGDWI